MADTLLHNARIVAPADTFDGWLRVTDGLITDIGPTSTPQPNTANRLDLSGDYLLPGFVDIHLHGGGGAAVENGPDQARHAIATHRRHGTVAAIGSLVTAPLPDLLRQCGELTDLADAGELAGIHLEGPFLSPSRAGAQDPTAMLLPDNATIRALHAACRGHLRHMTLAPELPGALDIIGYLVDHGVTAAIGHTDASYEQARAAVAAGARLGTHLFNGERELRHRDPGPIAALLEHPDVIVEVIADGLHVHDAILRMLFTTVGADRIALVSDAMAAAGASDGTFPLGPQQVVVAEGVAKLAGSDTIAGSTLTLDRSLHHLLAAGITIDAASTSLSATPARAIGIDAPKIAIGKPAHLVVADEAMTIRPLELA